MPLPELRTLDLNQPLQNYYSGQDRQRNMQMQDTAMQQRNTLFQQGQEDRDIEKEKLVGEFLKERLQMLPPDDPEFDTKKGDIGVAAANYASSLGIDPNKVKQGLDSFIVNYTPDVAKGVWTKNGWIQNEPLSATGKLVADFNAGRITQEQLDKAVSEDVPMTVKEWKYYETLSDVDKERYLTMKRANQYKDIGGSIVQPPQANPSGPPLAEIPKTLPPEKLPENVAAEATAKKQAEAGVEREVNFPKVRDTLQTLNRQWDLVDKKIDEAIREVSPFTTGIGAWVSVIPGTPQKNLSATLDTIKANIGFDKLQSMREMAKAGGALGQVSDFENRLLQAVQGSLDQTQSPKQLEANLRDVKKILGELRAQKKSSFAADYPDKAGSFSIPAPNGKTYTFKDQESLNAFKAKTGL